MKLSKGNKTALVFGGTGLIGRHLVQFLLLHPAYAQVVVFSRRPLALKHPKLRVEQIDFSKLDQHRSKIKGDDLFCCLGTTMKIAGSREAFYQVDYTYSFQIAQMARGNGVNQLMLVSSVGADPDSLFFYARVKGELENAVRQLDFWSIHIFRPSVLLGQRNENRWGEEIAGKISKVIDSFTGGLLSKYRPIEADTVAKAMVSAAQRLNGGQHIYPSHWLQELAAKETALIK